VNFTVVGPVADIESIATGRQIRDLRRIERMLGHGSWRKLKGVAMVQLPNGDVRQAELHWYEAHGIGRRMMKIKAFLDE